MDIPVLDTIGKISDVISSLSKEITQRDAEDNTPEVSAAAALEQIAQLIDKYREDIKNHNLGAFRQDITTTTVNSSN